MDRRDPAPYLSRLERRCAEEGLAVTVQRRAVMQALGESLAHPTADEIHAAVVERLPDVSRATVYRSLQTLDSLGLLRRVPHPGSAVRYDANTEPHHHFLCTSCGSLWDLAWDRIQGHGELRFEGAEADLVIQVHGVCARCAQPA